MQMNEMNAESKLAPLASRPFVWVILAACIPAAGALGAPFYGLDDHAMIHNNTNVTGPLSLKLFLDPHFAHYAPLHELALWIQWHFFGDYPLPYRIVSLLLHAGAGVACLAMLRNLTGRALLSLCVTLVWTVHAIQPESVDWISEQKTLLCGLFGFWSLAVYFDRGRPRTARTALAVLLMALGCLAKSSALVVAPIILLYELCVPQTESGRSQRLWISALLNAAPFLILCFIIVRLGYWATGNIHRFEPWHFSDMLMNLPGALAIYLRVAFLPWTASFYQQMDRVVSFASPNFWGMLAALICVYAAGIFSAESNMRRLTAFCGLAWVAGIGPMLNVTQWTFPAYDRYQYPALPFLLLGAALIVEGLLTRLAGGAAVTLNSARKAIWIAVISIAAITGCWRGMLFGHDVSVMLDATQKSPNNAYAYTQFAYALYAQWIRATESKNISEQQLLARTIGVAVRHAQSCPNFNDYYAAPISLLLKAGQVMHETGYDPEAIPFLEAAINDTRVAFFDSERADARRILATIALSDAWKHLQQAQEPQIAPDAAQELARVALKDVERSRSYFGESDRGWWYEFSAHAFLAQAIARNLPEKSEEEFRAAENALKQIQATSPFRKQADEKLVWIQQRATPKKNEQ
jgi:hypothetical protein